MSPVEASLLILLALSQIAAVLCMIVGYREGWQHGYGAGYDDRDDETLHGEKPGTRRGRSHP